MKETSKKQTKYLNDQHCPICDSDDVSINRFDASGDSATIDIDCNNCHATWMSVFRLEGFTQLQGGEETKPKKLKKMKEEKEKKKVFTDIDGGMGGPSSFDSYDQMSHSSVEWDLP